MDNFQVCRICISHHSVMMSIFGEDALWRKITSFANVHIEEGDSLPQQICIICAKDAISACSFKQKCEEADSYFRKLVLRQMELRLPEDTEIISIASAGMTGRGEEDESKCTSEIIRNKDRQQNDFEDNFPILMEDDEDQQYSTDDKFDDHLPLIPEIELITPNDDDSNHEIKDQYQCSVCFKCFTMKSVLKHHIRNCHPNANPMYECFECKKMYLSKRFLEKHVRMGRCVKKRKNTTRPMQCTECQTLFPTGHHLGWHKRTGNCRSRSPKLSLTEYEQRDESEINEQDNDDANGLNCVKKKFRKLKQKGRTRIKLDSKKIAYARELVKQQVSTTKFAQELKISRTFAWRLRKTIENNYYRDNKFQHTRISTAKMNSNEKWSFHNSTSTSLQVGNAAEINRSDGNFFEEFNLRTMNKESIIATNQLEVRNEQVALKQIEVKKEIDVSTDESDIYNCSQNGSFSGEAFNNILNNNKTVKGKFEQNLKDVDNLTTRRPRKPNVFIDEAKYAQAKMLVASNASTTEIAKTLDVSQMSAWKVRDCILKNIPLTFKKSSSIIPPAKPKKIEKSKPKIKKVPRKRLKRDEKVQRDKIIAKEILSMIKEDNNIQYWKVSERLAEKGFPISPSSVCQRLKAMGIHRRSRPNDDRNENSNTEHFQNSSAAEDDGDENMHSTMTLY